MQCFKCGKYWCGVELCLDCSIPDDSILIRKEDAKEFLEWVKGMSFDNSGQHICDRLAVLFAEKLGVPCP